MSYLFPVCFWLEKKPRLYAQQIPAVMHNSTMTTTNTPSTIPTTSISSVENNPECINQTLTCGYLEDDTVEYSLHDTTLTCLLALIIYLITSQDKYLYL